MHRCPRLYQRHYCLFSSRNSKDYFFNSYPKSWRVSSNYSNIVSINYYTPKNMHQRLILSMDILSRRTCNKRKIKFSSEKRNAIIVKLLAGSLSNGKSDLKISWKKPFSLFNAISKSIFFLSIINLKKDRLFFFFYPVSLL